MNRQLLIVSCIILFLTVSIAITRFARQQTTSTNYIASNHSTTSLPLPIESKPIEKNWGLGSTQHIYISNNRPYTWYIDQGQTEYEAKNNCGPAVAVMAAKWSLGDVNLTPEAAREQYKPRGGWWQVSDMTDYLRQHNIPFHIDRIATTDNIISHLDKGSILIVCLNTKYISKNDMAEERVGRFYNYADGHFLIIKGYRIVDGYVYFETYDPNSWAKKYNDGSLKGKNRYYLAEEVTTAIENWWDRLIVIEPRLSTLSK